jgi:heme-degrading monooxygenase HmoA
MFSVIFEVRPAPGQWDAYLGYAKSLKPELERIDGFVDNVRYRSLTRDGWILSLSSWRDEKALVRWRTHSRHHDAQERGRRGVLQDYHLRVGQITRDTRLPQGHDLRDQRLDETGVGVGTAVTLIDGNPVIQDATATPTKIANALGLRPDFANAISWDVFDAVLDPGHFIVLATWLNATTAEAFERRISIERNVRVRRVRIIRDYGMFDRREAPQYYPDVPRTSSPS